MRRILIPLLGALGLAAAGLPAAAQAPPPLTPVTGKVQSVEGSTLTVVGADGAATPVTLGPNSVISVVKRIDIADIKPGSFIGTTNKDRPDGAGTSTEVHVFPPGLRMGEGHYPFGNGNMMTNGDVTMTVTGATGQELEIKYNNCPPGGGACTPGGVRKVVVPPGTPVIAISPGDRSLLKPGVALNLMASKDDAGAMTAAFVNLGENGEPPPT